MAPPILLALAKHPLVDQYDLSSLTSILSGAAPLDEQLALAVAGPAAQGRRHRRHRGAGLRHDRAVAGLAHHARRGLRAARASRGDVPKGSVGYAIPNTECRLVDPGTGEDAADGRARRAVDPRPAGDEGLPQQRGGHRASTVDADGWLHTGDVAIVDDHGRYTVVDRVKELIKYKGYQVAPAELEAVLLDHPEIADAAVIGVPEKESGEELPKAFVVRAPGSELTEEAVMDYMAEKVAPHKKIRFVEFIDAVPKSAAGKILRKDLKARA